jgi:hypothetical protein
MIRYLHGDKIIGIVEADTLPPLVGTVLEIQWKDPNDPRRSEWRVGAVRCVLVEKKATLLDAELVAEQHFDVELDAIT